MICEMPAGLPVNQCHFYINTEENNTKASWKCELDLTGAEVLRWADVKSPASVDIYCFYEWGNNKSSHSPAVTVKVLVSTTATAAHTTTPAMTTSLTVRSTSETTTYSKSVDLHSKTNLPTNTTKETIFFTANSTLPGNRNMSEHVSAATSTQKTSPTNTETSTMAAISTTETPASTRTVVSSVHTSTAHSKDPPATKYTDKWFIVLVSTGVGVILTGFICLCWFSSKKRRKHNEPSQGIGMSCSGPAEMYSLITSVPATSQPISVGLEHPESHQDSTPDPTATDSFIMSENSIYQPSDVLVNTQQKEGNTEENENVYHLYCTIPDKPVHSNAGDQVYSLVKMH
ncbi:hypothetical protein PO909_020239 [Leuciscus waleckii]